MAPRTFGLVLTIGILAISCNGSDPDTASYSPVQSTKSGGSETNPVLHEGTETASKVSVPNLMITATNVPHKESDVLKLSLEIEADPAFSHYAYKVGTAKDCSTQGGYFVSEIDKPIVLNQEILPLGAVYLCLIGFHKNLQSWQPISDAKVYTWQKVPFRRSFKGYYEFNSLPGQCNVPSIIRGMMTLNIEGDKGSYVYSLNFPPNCPEGTNQTGVLPIVGIKTTETKMVATFIDNGVISWFDVSFTNSERTQFTGTWGSDTALGSNPLGLWNSLPP